MQLLRSNCDTEIKKREALQFAVQSLQLAYAKMQISVMSFRLNIENHVSCQNLKEELKRVGDEHNRKETVSLPHRHYNSGFEGLPPGGTRGEE
ncbi:hypothetical protein Leryth_008777 [Lithospermum erythrorhizon]|nr:hypothetical protein Leryth_008777 [Lithospermum erythrorhizon]